MRWSAQIHTKLHVHRITQEIPRRAPVFGYGPFTLFGAAFQKLHLTFALPHRAPTTPVDKSTGLACSAFARHYLRNQFLFLFLRLLRCFTSPGVATFLLCIHRNANECYFVQVIPFGNLRVKACLPLSVAYRSLPRPSSPIGTKASMMRSL